MCELFLHLTTSPLSVTVKVQKEDVQLSFFLEPFAFLVLDTVAERKELSFYFLIEENV